MDHKLQSGKFYPADEHDPDTCPVCGSCSIACVQFECVPGDSDEVSGYVCDECGAEWSVVYRYAGFRFGSYGREDD